MALDMLRNGNNALAVGHDPVIKLFQSPGAESVSAVKRGHVMDAGFLCRPIGAPGRCARTGVHDVDAVFPDKLRQLVGVFAHFENVFGFQRQRQMPDPDFFQVINQSAALRGDKVRNAVFLHAPGDFDRADFDAPHFQFGQNLQNNRFVFFTFDHFP